MKDLDKVMNELNLCEITSEDLGLIRRYLERFKFYFDIYLIVAVPMVFSKIKNLITKSIAYLVVFTIGFAYWYIIALYRPYWTETIDYRFFF